MSSWREVDKEDKSFMKGCFLLAAISIVSTGLIFAGIFLFTSIEEVKLEELDFKDVPSRRQVKKTARYKVQDIEGSCSLKIKNFRIIHDTIFEESYTEKIDGESVELSGRMYCVAYAAQIKFKSNCQPNIGTNNETSYKALNYQGINYGYYNSGDREWIIGCFKYLEKDTRWIYYSEGAYDRGYCLLNDYAYINNLNISRFLYCSKGYDY